MTFRTAATSVLVSLATLGLLAQGAAPGAEAITERKLRADLTFLASDALKGRFTNSAENLIAVEWVKSRFESLGLAPAAPDYIQRYNLMTVTLGAPNALAIDDRDAPAVIAHGDGYATQRFSATGSVRAGVVFAGFGITAADLAYDDYRAADRVRGKIALVLDHEPGERDPASSFDGIVTSDAGGALRKAQAAQAQGAVGILYVSDVHNHPGGGATVAAGGVWPTQPSRVGTYSLEGWMNSIRIPAAQISAPLAARLIKGTGRTLDDLAKAAETSRGFDALPLPGVEVSLTASVTRTPIPDRNVLAAIEGSDPSLRDEWVVISAHVDHDGANGAAVLNGADDDGSGTVGVMAIAEAYVEAARAGRRPRRSVLFAVFNSEERGLLGAWAYTLQPTAPLEKIVAVLNMDMIGRNEEVPEPATTAAPGRGGGGGRFNGLEPQTAASNANALNIIGAVRAPDLRAVADRANESTRLEIRYRYDNNASQLMRRSDHWPFIQHGVPGIWIFTGLHPDYHTPNDDADRINYEKMARILRLVHQMSWDLAQADGRPRLLPRRR